MTIDAEAGASSLARRLRHDDRRVVVIDDDPTGTQSVSNVDIVLRPGRRAFDDFFRSRARSLYVLSNSRALAKAAAATATLAITNDVRQAAIAAGRSVAFVYRGDSTLRGHIFAEIDAVAPVGAVTLFVPAFPEGGRFTADGVQWIDQDGARVAVADTEFAREPAFTYRSRGLVDWVRETGSDRSAIVVSLEVVRSAGAAGVCAALLAAEPGSVVITEAERQSDVEVAVCGLMDAEAAGRDIVVRSASTFAALRAGLAGRTITSVASQGAGRVLVVCGSNTTPSSTQLEALAVSTRRPVELLPTGPALARDAGHPAIRRLARKLEEQLSSAGVAILATERVRRAEHGDPDSGQRVMAALTDVVTSIRGSCDAVIAKGGITSADVARVSFGADLARVLGQVAVGVPLWQLDVDTRVVPYAVVPGNVGTADTLVEIARAFGVAA